MKIYFIFGSKNDMKYFEGLEDILNKLEIEFETQILSAHRNLEDLIDFTKSIENEMDKVIIGIAGYSAALPGIIASLTDSPVIGVPISSSPVQLDALLSMVQMPKGNPVAVMSYDKPGIINAIIYALKIFAIREVSFKEKVKMFKRELNIS